MIVNCDETECIHCNGEECTLDEITMCGECEDYCRCRDTADYQDEYWKCMLIKFPKDQKGRCLSHGKKITINGFNFYTENNTNLPENQIFLTDEKTGHVAGSVTSVKEHWDVFIKIINSTPDVMQYPICVYDCTKNEYVIEE